MWEETFASTLLVFLFKSTCSWACFGGGTGGGGRVCCPVAAPICAPAVPVCSNSGYGGYNYGSYGGGHSSYSGGGGSYSAPVIVNYPRPFGYHYPNPSFGGGQPCASQPCGGGQPCAENTNGHNNLPCPNIEVSEQQQQSTQQLFPNFQNQQQINQPCSGDGPCPSVAFQSSQPCDRPPCQFNNNNFGNNIDNHVGDYQTFVRPCEDSSPCSNNDRSGGSPCENPSPCSSSNAVNRPCENSSPCSNGNGGNRPCDNSSPCSNNNGAGHEQTPRDGGGHSCKDFGSGCGDGGSAPAEVDPVPPPAEGHHGQTSAETSHSGQGQTPSCEEASCHSYGPEQQQMLPLSSSGALPSPLPFAQPHPQQPPIAPPIQTIPEPPPPIPPHLPPVNIPLPSYSLPSASPSPEPFEPSFSLPSASPSPEPIPGPELESTYDEPETPQTPLPPASTGSPEPPSQPPLLPTQTEVLPATIEASTEALEPASQTDDYYEQQSTVSSIITVPPPPPSDASPPAPPFAQNPYETENEVVPPTSAQPAESTSVTSLVESAPSEYGEETTNILAEQGGEALTCDDVDLRKIVEVALKSSSDNLEAARRIEGDAAAKFGGRFNSIVSNNEFAYVNWYGKRNCQLRVNNRHSLTWED